MHLHLHDTDTGLWTTACGLKNPNVKGTWDVMTVTCVSCRRTNEFDRSAMFTPRSKQEQQVRADWVDAIFTEDKKPETKPQPTETHKMFTSGYYEGLTAAFKTLDALGAKLWNEGEEDSIGVTVAAQAISRMRLVFLGGEELAAGVDKINDGLIDALTKL